MPIKWRPFREFGKPLDLPDLFREQWVPFVPTFRAEEPAVDVYQDKNNLYIEISLGGLKPENINVSIENSVLTIEGKIEEKKETKKKDYLQKEIRKGSFRRVIKLPVEVVENRAKAESSGNTLKITVPKVVKPVAKSKRIPIEIK